MPSTLGQLVQHFMTETCRACADPGSPELLVYLVYQMERTCSMSGWLGLNPKLEQLLPSFAALSPDSLVPLQLPAKFQ